MSLHTIGHESLEAFVKTTQEVVAAEHFDTMLAASDSGHLASHLTKIVYQALDIAPPPAFIAPIFRHVDAARTIIFNNSVLAADFPQWRSHSFERALFTDDEIWRGNTLHGLLDLIMGLNATIDDLTVIAEDGGFAHGTHIRGIPLRYVSPKQRVTEIYNAFSYAVPDEYYQPVKAALSDESDINHKQVMCTLLGLPVKDRVDGKPCFSPRLLGKMALRVPDFVSYQQSFDSWLHSTVQEYMN